MSFASLIGSVAGRGGSSTTLGRVVEVGTGYCTVTTGRLVHRVAIDPGTTVRRDDTVRVVSAGGRMVVDGVSGRSLRKQTKEVWIDG